MPHIVYISTIISAGAAGILIGLLAVNLMRGGSLWPADAKWQRVVMLGLFRLFTIGMIITAILVLVLWDTGHWARYMIGLPFSIAAYAGSIWSYKILGKANTYFASQGLVTTGVYAYSRNPGYVGSFLAGLGLAMIAGSWVVSILAALLWAVYLAFALNEERWLGTIYGRGFDAYMAQTPRFLDMRSLKRAMADMRG